MLLSRAIHACRWAWNHEGPWVRFNRRHSIIGPLNPLALGALAGFVLSHYLGSV